MMSAMEGRRIRYQELTLLEFKCPNQKCTGSVQLNMANDADRALLARGPEAGRGPDARPFACSRCGETFSKNLRDTLRAFHLWQQDADKEGYEITFMIPGDTRG